MVGYHNEMHGVRHADKCIAFNSREFVGKFDIPTPDRETGAIQPHFVGCLIYMRLPWVRREENQLPTRTRLRQKKRSERERRDDLMERQIRS